MNLSVFLVLVVLFLPLPFLIFGSFRGKFKLLIILGAIVGYILGALLGLGLGAEILNIDWWSLLTGVVGGVLGYFLVGGWIRSKIQEQ